MTPNALSSPAGASEADAYSQTTPADRRRKLDRSARQVQRTLYRSAMRLKPGGAQASVMRVAGGAPMQMHVLVNSPSSPRIYRRDASRRHSVSSTQRLHRDLCSVQAEGGRTGPPRTGSGAPIPAPGAVPITEPNKISVL